MAINKSAEMKLISTKRMGVPCKTYYKINENEILKLCENTKRNYKSNYEQRVYPEGFFDQFYANLNKILQELNL